MHNSSASQFMDKQIMDLSNSQANANTANSGSDFIDFMNRAPSDKKDDVVPSYDFLPIRSDLGSSTQPSNFGSRDDDAPVRSWNSLDSKTNTNPIRIYSTFDVGDEPTNFVPGKHNNHGNESLNAPLVSEIDRTLKKYAEEIMHAVDSVSARLSQLETRTRKLESSIDDLKVSVENNHGSTEGKMRHLENILGEVQNGVQIIRDKQEILEAHQEIAKLPVPKGDQHIESHKPAHTDSNLTAPSPHQQFSTAPPPNAPPPPPTRQNIQPQASNPSQFPPNQQTPPPYFHPPNQIQEKPSQQYQIPPPMQQQQQQPPPPPPHHQYQPPPPTQYPPQPPPSQPHLPPFPPVAPSPPQPPLSHQPEETPYPPSPQPYSQQYYPPSSNAYESAPIRPGPGYPAPFGPPSAYGGSYPYDEPSHYVGSIPMKTQQAQNPSTGQGIGSGYQHLPAARILPQALPAGSNLGGGSGSPGAGNRVPIEDVVDRVTNMGFPRDHVRATVRRLTESGQAADVNIVLDKLMNEGEGHGQRSWLAR